MHLQRAGLRARRALIVLLALGLAMLPAACSETAPNRVPATSPGAAPTTIPAPTPSTDTAEAASPDFDGDGKADLAYTHEKFGGVSIRYGTGKVVDINPAALAGGPARVDGSLLAHDLNGDGYADLLFEVRPSDDMTYRIHVLFGSATGLRVAAAKSFPLPAGRVLTLSAAVVSAPVPRLVLGLRTGITAESAQIAVYDLGTDGLPAGEPTVLSPGTGRVPLSAGYNFGYNLATWQNHLFVGASTAIVDGVDSGGVLAVDFGTAGVTSTAFITKDTDGVPGTPGSLDYFGGSLAARDGYLAVGSPNDSSVAEASGSVEVFRITDTGLVPDRNIWLGSPDIEGTPEPIAEFGERVALGTICPGVTGLIIGDPDFGPATSDGSPTGAVWLVPLQKKAGCNNLFLQQGGKLPGRAPSGFRTGSDVAVLRDRGSQVDTIAFGGAATNSPTGRLFVWSTRTGSVIDTIKADPRYLAGR